MTFFGIEFPPNFAFFVQNTSLVLTRFRFSTFSVSAQLKQIHRFPKLCIHFVKKLPELYQFHYQNMFFMYFSSVFFADLLGLEFVWLLRARYTV